jgi:hypothetical protein
MCCHHTHFHISTAVVSAEFIEALSTDSLGPDQYLIVRRGEKYDLAAPDSRKRAILHIIGILRYLRSLAQ